PALKRFCRCSKGRRTRSTSETSTRQKPKSTSQRLQLSSISISPGESLELRRMRWNGADSLVLIEAVAPGRTPGAIYRLDASVAPLDRELFTASTHAFSLADAVELSRSLGTLPLRALVFGHRIGECHSRHGLVARSRSCASAIS